MSTEYPAIVPFGTFFYKSATFEGMCEEWSSYRRNDISLPFDYLYISGLLIPILDIFLGQVEVQWP